MNAQANRVSFAVIGVVFLIASIGWLDWRTGYELNFFVFYFIPVSLAAWAFGAGWSVVVAIICACIWAAADKLSGHHYSTTYFAVWNTMNRLTAFVAIGYSVHKIGLLLRSEKAKSAHLSKALSEIRILESFLSICCVCKKIRNEDGSWQQLESYISGHSDTKFSHGYCPDCAKKALEEAGLGKG